MKQSDRLDALMILTDMLQQRTPLTHLLQAKPSLSPLTKEICFGTARHFMALEAIASKLVHKKPKDLSIWLCILTGLYQLHFLNIPDYAVVKETVALLESLKKTWAKGLVNAILRRYCREKDTLDAQLREDSNYQHNHPDWFVERVQHHWPDNWRAILSANDAHPPMSLRVNQSRIDRDAYLSQLQAHGIDGNASAVAPSGIVLTKACSVHDLPGFSLGMVSVQDLAAQLAVSLLDLQPGLRVLDMCCAPGGKTMHILETEPDLAACVAVDVEATRLERVHENLKRLNLHAITLASDGLRPETWWDNISFDRILLDAPCSATGVIRRHPDIKLLRTPEEIHKICVLQQDLLQTLWPLLAAGGRLVYATCSIMPEENEKQIAQFVASQSDCRVLTISPSFGHATDHGWQLLPGENNMDGFFYSVLLRDETLMDNRKT